MSREILVIGGRGFIGSAIVRGLRQRGHRVCSTVFSGQPECDEFRLDIRDPDSFTGLPQRRFDIVINASGSVDNRLSRGDLFSLNNQGARNISDWSDSNDCQHLIQISSTAAYGAHSIGQQRRESSHRLLAYIGVDYQRSKASAERYISRQTTPFTLLRMPAVFGVGDSFISPVISENLLQNSYFRCGTADKLISLMAVDCLGDMLHRVVSQGAKNTVFNCASHHVHWSALIAEYAQALRVEVPGHCKSLLTLPLKLRDMHHLFLLTSSRFGAHFPTHKFDEYYGESDRQCWRDIVQKSAHHYRDSLSKETLC